MYSAFRKVFADGKFKNEYIWSIYFSVIILCLILIIKKVLKRRSYFNSFPSKKVSLFNILGNIMDIKTNAVVKDLHFTVYILEILMGFNELFKTESLFFFDVSYFPYVFVTKAKAVEEVIAGSKNLEKNWMYSFLHPWLGTGLLTSHGSKWKSRRKLLTPSFHFEILKDFLPIFNKQSQILVKLLEKETKKNWTDIVTPVTLCSLDIVCETTFGVCIGAQKDSQSEYVQAVSRTSHMVANRVIYPPYHVDWYFFLSCSGRQFRKDLKLLHNFTRKVITDKKQKLLSNTKEESETNGKKRKALLDLLLEQHIQNQSLTEEDIREEVDTFAFGGHDTTSMSMSWALYLIGLDQKVQDELHEEIDRIFGDDYERPVTIDDLRDLDYLDRVVKEALRLYPSVPVIARNLSEDTIICGKKVPKNVGVVIFTYAVHRDESVFPNPEKFDPDRFLPENTAKRSPFAYIPFSAGPRNCIGQRFAIMEEKVVIANVLRHYSLESVDARDKVLTASELILRAVTPIKMKIKSRRPLSS